MDESSQTIGAEGAKLEPNRKLGDVLALGLWGATIVLTLATLLAFLGHLTWWMDLFCHFRFQYFWLSALLLLGFGLLRQRFGAIGAGTLLAINGAVIAPLFFSGVDQPSVESDQPRLRILISNVASENKSHRRLIRLVQWEQPDLILLQEVTETWLSALEVLEGEYPYRVERPGRGNFGMALLSRFPLNETSVEQFGHSSTAWIQAHFEFEGERITMIQTHFVPPYGSESTQLRNQQAITAANRAHASGEHTILAGDFNLTPWSPVFAKVLEGSNLNDSARGFGLQPTWPSSFPAPCRIPIDHCFQTSDFEVLDRRTGPNIGSDHFPLIVDLLLR